MMQGTSRVVVGAKFETDASGQLRCVSPGWTTYSSDWPAEALAEIARLRSALVVIAEGEGDPAVIARQTLDGTEFD